MDVTSPSRRPSQPCRRSIRLIFAVSKNKLRLRSYRRLQATCPPAVGALPDRRTASGLWLELRDADDKVLFHKLLQGQFHSVEVARPDGTFERRFAKEANGEFQVLIPDLDEARSLVVMGDLGIATKKGKGSDELMRIEVPDDDKGVLQ